MVLPRALASFNRQVTNPIAGLVAGKVPVLAVVRHVGRHSGRAYRTPVWAFEAEGEFRIALTYGIDSEWVKNVLAAGEFALETQGRTVELIDPAVLEDRSASWAPFGVRQALQLLGAKHYLRARRVV